MPDVRGLISDPEFRSLPKERQRALLQQIGVKPEFIDEIVPIGAEAALRGAEAISEVPAVDRPLRLMPWLPQGQGPEAPSPLQLFEGLPGVGGAIGAALGGPSGAALGAGGGEAVRQLLRRISGYAPATGLTQEQLGLDPNSPLAAIASLGAEVAGGGTAESVAARLLGKPAQQALREKGLRTYAKGLSPKMDEKALQQTIKRLRVIQEELPTGPSGRIARVAEKKAEKAGEKVGATYGAHAEEPSSYEPAQKALAERREKLVETPGKIAEVPDPVTGEMREEWIPPVVRDEKLWEAFNKRIASLRSAERRKAISGVDPETGREIPGGPVTVGDLFERRKSLSEQVQRESRKAFQIGVPTKEMRPPIQATKAERTALSETLHGQVPGGKEVDELFSAWSTVKEGEPGSSHFLARWAASRMTPGGGIPSTIAGVIANQSMLWRSGGNKILRGMAAALEAGDKVQFEHLLRAAVSQVGEPSKERAK